MEFGPGNAFIIRGEGTGSPRTFNVLSFSADGNYWPRVRTSDVWSYGICRASSSYALLKETKAGHGSSILARWSIPCHCWAGDKLSLRLWHLPDCKLAHTYRFTHSFIKSLAYVPKSSSLIVWDNATTTYVLNTRTEDPPLELKGVFQPVLSEDGTIMITTSVTEFAFWQPQTGRNSVHYLAAFNILLCERLT